MSNSVDPDETTHDEPSHQDLRCLQMPVIIAYGGERVNTDFRQIARASSKRCLNWTIAGRLQGVQIPKLC